MLPPRTTTLLLATALNLSALFTSAARENIFRPYERAPLVEFPPEAKLIIGEDQRAFANPTFDDSSWDTITLGDPWPAPANGKDLRDGWYRIRFHLPSRLSDRPLALSLGFVANITEIYLNGKKIGGVGSFRGNQHPTARRIHMAPIPPDLAHFGSGPQQENLLALRVRTLMPSSGILGGPIGIYDTETIYRLRKTDEFSREYFGIGTIALSLSLAVALFVLSLLGGDTRGFASVSLLAALIGLKQIPFLHGFQSSAFHGAASILLNWLFHILLPLAAYLFVRRSCPVAGHRRLDIAVILLGIAGFCATGYFGHDLSKLAQVLAWYYIAAFTAIFFTLFRARRAGSSNVLTSLLVLLPLVLGFVLEAAAINIREWRYIALPVTPGELSGPLFVAVTGIVVISRFILTQRRAERLRRALFTAHEEERRRIGHNLHDGLAQDLQALHLEAQRAKDENPGTEKLATGLRSALGEVRAVAEDLQPLHLRNRTLGEALQSLAAAAAAESEAKVTAEISPGLPELGPHRCETAFRIAQEALHNALRHGEPKEARLTLSANPEHLHLTIHDDGVGFDPATAAEGERLGLKFMRDRAELAGGHLDIDSAPGQGATLTLTLPLD